MSLEDVLKVIEKDTVDRRHPGKYHFSIFGTPERPRHLGISRGRPPRQPAFHDE
jgi:hypothetical protein